MPESATLESAPAAEVTAPDDFLASLTSDSEPPAPPQPAEPVPGSIERPEVPKAPSPAVPGEEPSTLSAVTAAVPAPKEKTLKFRGRDYTATELTQQLAQKPELLEDLTQSYEQLPNLSRKHQELLERIAGAQPQAQMPSEQPASQQPPITIGMLETAYRPQLDALVQGDWLEGDLVELYPKALSQQLLMRDLLMDTRRAVGDLMQWRGQLVTSADQITVDQQVNGALDQLTGQGGHFDLLKDPKVREDFRGFIVELNPQRKQLTPEFLGRQFAAFNQDVLLEAARQANEQVQKDRAQKVRQAQGGTTSSRPMRAPEGEADHLWDLVR